MTHFYQYGTWPGDSYEATLTVPPEGGTATFTLWSGSTIEFRFWLEDITTNLQDVTHFNGVVSGFPGLFTWNFDIHSDDLVEGDEQFAIALDFCDGCPGSEPIFHPGVIDDMDDQNTTVPFSIMAANAAEGTGISLLARFDDEPLAPYEFEYWTENVTATAGEDYESASGTFSLDPSTTGSFVEVASIITNDDITVNGNRSFQIHVRPVGDDDPEHELVLNPIIVDNDVLGAFNAIVDPVVEGGDLLLLITSTPAMEFEYYVQDVSAIGGINYTDPNSTSPNN